MEILVYEPFMEAYAFADIKKAASDTSGAVVSRTLSYERKKKHTKRYVKFRHVFTNTRDAKRIHESTFVTKDNIMLRWKSFVRLDCFLLS